MYQGLSLFPASQLALAESCFPQKSPLLGEKGAQCLAQKMLHVRTVFVFLGWLHVKTFPGHDFKIAEDALLEPVELVWCEGCTSTCGSGDEKLSGGWQT